MSNSSDSDEYYDAEDNTPSKLSRKPKGISLTPSKSESDFQSTLRQDDKRQEPPRVPSSLALHVGNEFSVGAKKSAARKASTKRGTKTREAYFQQIWQENYHPIPICSVDSDL